MTQPPSITPVAASAISTITDRNELLRALTERAKTEIIEDVTSGRVPATVYSFGDLHSFVDANEYGGVCEDAILQTLNRVLERLPEDAQHDNDCVSTQATMRFCNELQDAVNLWIEQGGIAKASPRITEILAAVLQDAEGFKDEDDKEGLGIQWDELISKHAGDDREIEERATFAFEAMIDLNTDDRFGGWADSDSVLVLQKYIAKAKGERPAGSASAPR